MKITRSAGRVSDVVARGEGREHQRCVGVGRLADGASEGVTGAVGGGCGVLAEALHGLSVVEEVGWVLGAGGVRRGRRRDGA